VPLTPALPSAEKDLPALEMEVIVMHLRLEVAVVPQIQNRVQDLQYPFGIISIQYFFLTVSQLI
jgi:hypothetical protein